TKDQGPRTIPMDIGPILPGRVPGSLLSERLTSQLQDTHRTLTQLQDELATGQRFVLPSDDPAAAARTINLQMLVERKTQMITNGQTDQSFLSARESSLSSISDALNRAKEIAPEGFGDSSSPAEKQGMMLEAQSLLKQLVNIGNSTFRGRYLFGGS